MIFRRKKPRNQLVQKRQRRPSLRINFMAFMGILGLTTVLVAAFSTAYSVYQTEQVAWKGRQLEAAHNAADKVAIFITHGVCNISGG